jgi:hypothetical protein
MRIWRCGWSWRNEGHRAAAVVVMGDSPQFPEGQVRTRFVDISYKRAKFRRGDPGEDQKIAFQFMVLDSRGKPWNRGCFRCGIAPVRPALGESLRPDGVTDNNVQSREPKSHRPAPINRDQAQ